MGNGKFYSLSSGTPALRLLQVGEAGEDSLLFLVPQIHEEFHHCWSHARGSRRPVKITSPSAIEHGNFVPMLQDGLCRIALRS
jgi:hypothetical protein